VCRADILTTFMCRNLGASTSWIHKGLYRPVMGLLYHLHSHTVAAYSYVFCFHTDICIRDVRNIFYILLVVWWFRFAFPLRITPTTLTTFIVEGDLSTFVSCYPQQRATVSALVHIERLVTNCGCSSELNQQMSVISCVWVTGVFSLSNQSVISIGYVPVNVLW
jgi:hypothetical protein